MAGQKRTFDFQVPPSLCGFLRFASKRPTTRFKARKERCTRVNAQSSQSSELRAQSTWVGFVDSSPGLGGRTPLM